MIRFEILHFLLFAFLFAAGCDYAERRTRDAERSGRLYHDAMEEYAAGRLDKSIGIFKKVVAQSPENASARFQLACLEQDHAKDYLAALCNYREYLMLAPDGDKVGIASERMATCERNLASQLILKYKLGGSAAQDAANARLREDRARMETELESARAANEKLTAEIAALKRENARVRRMVLAQGEDDSTAVRTPKPSEDLAEAEDAESLTPTTDRIKLSGDIAQLVAEEKEEVAEAAPFAAPPAPAPETVGKMPKEPPHETRPETYVVQEGDTLFRIALRFYGRRSAWSSIRDANKTIVSPDGRIKVGQKLRLP